MPAVKWYEREDIATIARGNNIRPCGHCGSTSACDVGCLARQTRETQALGRALDDAEDKIIALQSSIKMYQRLAADDQM